MARAKASGPAVKPWIARPSWVIPGLIVAALALYSGSLHNPLVFDDALLSEKLLRAYGRSLFQFDLRWLSYASFGWTFEAVGREWFWHRLLNVLLHAGTASMLFLFLSRLFALVVPATAEPRATLSSGWMAAFGALLFLAHPVAVYGVAYLIQRSIVLATLLSLASLYCFLEGMTRGARSWFVASAAAYFAAVFSKEHCVALPAVAAALAVLVRGWPPRPLKSLALPFALYAAIGAAIVLRARGLLGAQYEPFAELAASHLPGPETAGGAADRYALSVLNQGFLFFRYLLTWLLPLPSWMSVDLRTAFPAQLANWPQTAGFAAWLAWPVVSSALLVRGGRVGLAGFAMLGPWLLALPEVAAVRVQEPLVLYRSYLWMCLLPAAVPVLLMRIPAKAGGALLAVVCLALLPPFFNRLQTFSSDYRLWDDAVRKNADWSAAYVDRGFRNRGVAQYQAGRYREALRDFTQAIDLNPRNPRSWQLRGALYMRAGRHESALADLGRALELAPDSVDALGPRCVVLMRLQRLDEAQADCARAFELAPDAIDHSISLGMVSALRGSTGLAERYYQRALQIDPESMMARYQYGVLLRDLGRAEEARRQFYAACEGQMQIACLALGRMGARK
jgi:tetratricopeptide (TPR) repeat protein